MDEDVEVASAMRDARFPGRGRRAGRPGGAGSHPYRVGEPFAPGRRGWAVGSAFAPDRRGYALTLFRAGVTGAERAAFRARPAEFALLVHPPVVVLCFRLGGAPAWEALPYAWPLDDRPGKGMPRSRAGGRSLLWVSLVEARDGIIQAQRGVALAPGFAAALGGALRRQAAARFDGDAHVDALARAYLDSPSPSAMALRATVRTSSLD